MDDRRFDRIARLVAAASSRRQAIRNLVALVAGGATLATAGPNAEARRGEACHRRRCKRKADCCNGYQCCGRRCTRTRFDRKNCGACGNRCSSDQMCYDGTCMCSNAACGAACCDFEQACLDETAGTCGACPAGAGIDDPANEVACGGTYGDFTECYCVTSVDGVAGCSGIHGFCVDCESDDQCSLAMGAQALCIPVGDECDRYNAQRACVEATCYGGPTPVRSIANGRSSIPGAGPYMRLRPERRDR